MDPFYVTCHSRESKKTHAHEDLGNFLLRSRLVNLSSTGISTLFRFYVFKLWVKDIRVGFFLWVAFLTDCPFRWQRTQKMLETGNVSELANTKCKTLERWGMECWVTSDYVGMRGDVRTEQHAQTNIMVGKHVSYSCQFYNARELACHRPGLCQSRLLFIFNVPIKTFIFIYGSLFSNYILRFLCPKPLAFCGF